MINCAASRHLADSRPTQLRGVLHALYRIAGQKVAGRIERETYSGSLYRMPQVHPRDPL
jgi:hypothetical protein